MSNRLSGFDDIFAPPSPPSIAPKNNEVDKIIRIEDESKKEHDSLLLKKQKELELELKRKNEEHEALLKEKEKELLETKKKIEEMEKWRNSSSQKFQRIEYIPKTVPFEQKTLSSLKNLTNSLTKARKYNQMNHVNKERITENSFIRCFTDLFLEEFNLEKELSLEEIMNEQELKVAIKNLFRQ